MRPADPAWRLETLLAGQAQAARLGGADASEAQSCPDFPVALTMQRAVGQQLADGFDQGLVRHWPERNRLRDYCPRLKVVLRADSGLAQAPTSILPSFALGLSARAPERPSARGQRTRIWATMRSTSAAARGEAFHI
jgi:hypothetical protein